MSLLKSGAAFVFSAVSLGTNDKDMQVSGNIVFITEFTSC